MRFEWCKYCGKQTEQMEFLDREFQCSKCRNIIYDYQPRDWDQVLDPEPDQEAPRYFKNETENCLLDVICDFRPTLADKLKLLVDYKQIIRPEAYRHLWELVFFNEKIKRLYVKNGRKFQN